MADTKASAFERIAIVGMAGRFPGAANVAEFWRNLCDGVDSTVAFSADDLIASGVDPGLINQPGYVSRGAPLEEADCFDAEFFGYLPREAELMDPQHRVFLECAWAALEHAGYDVDRFPGAIGVFGGVARNTYLLNCVLPRADILQTTNAHQLLIASDKDFPATRVSFKLNLRGPSLNVQTACSSSGVAIHLACQSLLSGESDMALAGGGRVKVPLRAGYEYEEGGIQSPDGHCRPFDAQAAGTIMGSGMALVVLKRLSDALADRDTIYAVIRATAINNDGSAKVGFTAPSVDGQSRVIAEAHTLAEVSADTISYVEAHGTGTRIGDPIEVAALTQAFRRTTTRKAFCAIGSLKANIGHLDAGAGVAGVIKTALALKHRLIPPSIHYATPNPEIDFASSPFYVNDSLREWDGPGPRRAGVSSFGLGGTNAHIVLEEVEERRPPGESSGPHVLVLSAQSPSALDRASDQLAHALTAPSAPALADVAWTLQTGRKPFKHRLTVVSRTAAEAAAKLKGRDRLVRLVGQALDHSPSCVFVFPGGGVQYPDMGREIYEAEPVYRDALDQCLQILRNNGRTGLRELLFPDADDRASAAATLETPSHSIHAIFVTEYALARLLMAWGLLPAALMGHSLGEYVAACLAGVFSLEDALRIVSARGDIFDRATAGAMLSVPLTRADVLPLLSGRALSLAAANAPGLCTVSGSVEAIEEFQAHLATRGVEAARLRIAVGAHSHLLDPYLQEFAGRLANVRLARPNVPIVSNLTGTWAGEEMASPDYWVRHLRHTVQFSAGVKTLLAEPNRVFIEVGPGQVLNSLVRAHVTDGVRAAVIPAMRHPQDASLDRDVLATALGRAWMAGLTPDWVATHHAAERQRVGLPTYPFERKRIWIDPVVSAVPPVQIAPVSPPIAAPMKSELGTPDMPAAAPTASRLDRVLDMLKDIIQDMSGVDREMLDENATFLDLGFESLFLTQATSAFHNRFGVQISFRQLFEQTRTLATLAAYIDSKMPADKFAAPVPPPPATPTQASGFLEQFLAQQLQVMSAQMEVLRVLAGQGAASLLQPAPQPAVAVVAPEPTPATATTASPVATVPAAAPKKAEPKSFGPWKPIEKGPGGALTARQRQHLDDLIARFNAKTPRSKAQAQRFRAHLSDPRTVAGFRLPWKELVYPIVAERSKGSKIWDVDGNEWIDITQGYGVNLFGHSPDFVVQAVEAQLQKHIGIGPQCDLTGPVAEMLCELTGLERVAFCNTGSEAVLAAVRVARTVTGRHRIAYFTGDYHGIFDEVLGRGVTGSGGQRKSVPVAPGITPWSVENVLILDYGDPESLKQIEANAHDLAGVLVEPVQSRRPDFQPRVFLQALRALTEKLDVPLIFDEVITGFRCHQGGAQALFGVKADIASYGKVVGGSLPIGIVAGRAKYLDALDGGHWQFGDTSVPEVGVTWFAGTFVRHPIAMAAAHSVLTHLKAEGPQLQEQLNARTAAFANELNEFFTGNRFPIRINQFSSLFHIAFEGDHEFTALFWHHLRNRLVHCHEGRPNFFTTAHSAADIAYVANAFRESAQAMREAGFLPEPNQAGATIREVPITEEQQEIWLACQLSHEASCSFNLTYSMHFRGRFDIDAMRRAVQLVVDRHESLRMTFSDDGTTGRIHPTLKMDVPLLDWTDAPETERERRVQELIDRELEFDFNLANGPLIRAQVARLTGEHHYVLLSVAHLAADGFAVGTILRELAATYSALVQGLDPGLPEAYQYSAYAERQAQLRATPDYTAALDYWVKLCSTPGLPPPLDLPSDRPRPASKTFRSAVGATVVDRQLCADLRRSSAKSGRSLFATLLGGFSLWAHRYSGLDDLIIGIPASGQSICGQNSLVGHCAHHHPFRSRVDWNLPVSELLSRTQSGVLDAVEQRIATEGAIVPRLGIPRDPSRLPLINLQFNMDPAPLKATFHGVESEVFFNARHYSFPDVNFNLVEKDGEIVVRCEFNADLFEITTVDGWFGSLQTILRGIVEDPSRSAATFPILADAERRKIMEESNATAADFPLDACLHDIFEAQVRQSPQRPALLFEDRSFTYAELNERADQLAAHLRTLAVGPDVLVGICVERSPEMVVAVLATLKAGGAYVPIDPAHPKDRTAFVLDDAGVAVLLTQRSLEGVLPSSPAHRVFVDEPLPPPSPTSTPAGRPTGANLAYVIYTSGSTGKPKGVQSTHRGAVNVLTAIAKDPGFTSRDTLLAVTTLSFDIAVAELFLPLLNGGRLVLAGKQVSSDGPRLRSLLEQSEATFLQPTPATWRLLLESGWSGSPSLRMISTGEALPRDLAERLLPKGAGLWNLYGPTETTIWSTGRRITNADEIDIGRPLANTEVYVLDERQQPVPIGVIGELYIGGAGLARGYLHRPELTNERFVPHPFKPDARLYRTGDRVRWLRSGNIEFLGRLDYQVKLRGFRIELGEIEAALRDEDGIEDAVVLLREDTPGAPRLVAYTLGQKVPATTLRAALTETLPDHAVPTAFIPLDAWPRTPNGKLDRGALPAPSADGHVAGRVVVEPRTTTEQALAQIWARLLGVERIGVDDDFFDLGGHSLLAMRVRSEVQDRLGITIDMRRMFDLTTIAAMAEYADGLMGALAAADPSPQARGRESIDL